MKMKTKLKQKTKQKMKQLSALFLALLMVCALSLTAFAAEENGTDSNEAQSGSQTASLAGTRLQRIRFCRYVLQREGYTLRYQMG